VYAFSKMSQLDGWENFYVIIGSSAGTLIGLQFVVMALVADMPARRVSAQAGNAFATPNVVHFAVVLLISALTVAPWDRIGLFALLWGLIGVFGVIYVIVIVRRMRSQTAYKAVFEDWLCHVVLPFAAYTALAASACAAAAHTRSALFTLGAASLLLLFIGIHNAWDTVMYQVFEAKKQKPPEPDEDP
jgi:hypothetical protein